MKKIRSFVIAIAIALTALVCVPTVMMQDTIQTVEAATVKLNKTKTTLNVGLTTTLKVKGTTKKVTWSSSDRRVATVSSSGKVTAKGIGQATIKAKVGGKTYSCKVTVNNKKTFSDVGDTTTLKVYGTSKKVVWSSSDKRVATVTSSGKVTAKGLGQATIYAKVNGKTFAKCVVTVNDEKIFSDIGNTVSLKVNGTKKKITWSSSNKSVVSVSNSGKVTAKGLGQATVYAKVDGKTFAKCVFKVNDEKTLSEVGDTTTLKVYNTSKKITWSSSDRRVATVTSSGKVTAKGLGQATIYAKIGENTYAKCVITVNNEKTLSDVGDTTTLKVNGTKKAITWSSSNKSVVSVSNSGKVTAKGLGQATIYAKVDGKTFAKCIFKVNDEKTFSEVGNKITLKVYNTSKTVKWSSSDEQVATVTSDGVVTAKGLGQATIYAKVSGNTYAKCVITVNDEKTLSNVGKTTTLSVEGTKKTITWSSSDRRVATVTSDGVVTAKGLGKATVYAKVDGKTFSKCVVTVNTKETLTAVGDTITLKANGTKKTIAWSSSNAKVAAVSDTGVVTANGIGKATIYAKVDGATFAKCVVTVKSTSGTKVIKGIGNTTTYNVGFTQSDVTWSSSNANVATVTSAGVIQATGAGKATIYAKVGNTTYGKCVVTVKADTSAVISEIGNTTTVNVGKTAANMTWSSSNTNVATVSSTGKVTAKGLGTATIYAKADGVTYGTCVVTVKVNTEATISKVGETTKVNVGNTAASMVWNTSNAEVATVTNGVVTAVGMGQAKITAEIGGVTVVECFVKVNATYEFTKVGRYETLSVAGTSETVTWSSSNVNVADVDRTSGRVRSVGMGQATITATVGGSVYAQCIVTVNTTGTVQAGYSLTLSASSTSGVVTWVTSDETIATVENGKVIGRKAGEATITALVDGKTYASCVVTVTSNPDYELWYYLLKNGTYNAEANSYSVSTTTVYDAKTVQQIAGIIGEFPVETIPVESIITYNATERTITFVSDIDMHMQLSDFEGYSGTNAKIDMKAQITMVYDINKKTMGQMRFKLDGNSPDGIRTDYGAITNLFVGVAYSNMNYKQVTPIVANADEVIGSMSDLGFAMSTVSNEKLNPFIVLALKQQTGIEVTETDFLLAAEYQGNVALYEWDKLLETLPVHVTLNKLGFDNYIR